MQVHSHFDGLAVIFSAIFGKLWVGNTMVPSNWHTYLSMLGRYTFRTTKGDGFDVHTTDHEGTNATIPA